MQQPYQILIDFWQGNPIIDVPTLKAAGVVGAIVRLNDMNGGLHMDTQFTHNWEVAKQFDVQTIYYVYTPWQTGRENFDWMLAHLPQDYGLRRLMIDTEVRRENYAPHTYAAEHKIFRELVRGYFPEATYSGGGSLGLLDAWPVDEDYWWAGYAYGDETRGGIDLRAAKTWDQYRERLARLDFAAYTHYCPNKAKMWQCSGDGVLLPGFNGHAVDVSVFPGTLEDLRAWFNGPTDDGGYMTWTNDAIGLYTKTAGWTNPAWKFIVGHAGGEWSDKNGAKVLEPNPSLAPIETQAHNEGKPFVALWDFDVTWYSDGQYIGDDQHWPPEATDYPLQSLIRALANRDVNGLIIRVMNRKNAFTGKDELMSYVAFAARKFVERANRWLYTNKGLDKWTFVLSSDPFMKTKNPDGSSNEQDFYIWTKNWYLGIEQQALSPLADNAWPHEGDAIKAVPSSLGWKFWFHYNTASLDMMLFNGAPEDMNKFLGYGTVTPPPPPPPNFEARVNTLEVEYGAQQQQITNQQQQITTLANALAELKKHTHATGEPMI